MPLPRLDLHPAPTGGDDVEQRDPARIRHERGGEVLHGHRLEGPVLGVLRAQEDRPGEPESVEDRAYGDLGVRVNCAVGTVMVCQRRRHKTDLHTRSNREKESKMPLYMDIHESVPEGTTAQDVAGAHAADLSVQGKVRRRLPQLLGRRGQREGLLPGRGTQPGGGRCRAQARPTGSWPTTSTRWSWACDAARRRPAASLGLGPRGADDCAQPNRNSDIPGSRPRAGECPPKPSTLRYGIVQTESGSRSEITHKSVIPRTC